MRNHHFKTVRWHRQVLAALAFAAVASGVLVHAQGRGGGEWTTAGFDAQRTGWLRSDARLTKESLAKEFTFLWKHKFDNENRQLNSLTQPVLLDRLIGFRGFKALAFVGGSDDRIFAIDSDLARPYWTTILNYSANTGGQPPSSWRCPGGLIATPTRRTVLAPSAFAGGGGGGGRGGRSGSAVGEPGRGAAVLAQMAQAPAQGRGAAQGPPPAPAGRGNAAATAIPFGGVDPIYVVATDGYLHTLRSSNGSDSEPASPFLPPSAKPSALIFVDGIVYASTSDECGASPNAVYALDLTAEGADRKVVTWRTGGASVAGTSGPALGSDGTLFVALGKAPAPRPVGPSSKPASSHADAVIALDRKTLTPKDWFTADGADFNSSPMVIKYKGKDLVAATANDGKLYVLDSASLGGTDHKTPLAVSAKFTAPGAGTSLATFETDSATWILATSAGAPPATAKFTSNGVVTAGAVVAFRIADEAGKVSLQPAWSSRDLVSPLGPIVVNGMVFAISSGEFRGAGTLTAAQRAQRSTPAVLYALDAATGKTLWSSGRTITSFARSGLTAGSGQVYVVTYDNTLYTFGIPMEH
jgi:outer membrane protein assembly factor BamB